MDHVVKVRDEESMDHVVKLRDEESMDHVVKLRDEESMDHVAKLRDRRVWIMWLSFGVTRVYEDATVRAEEGRKALSMQSI